MVRTFAGAAAGAAMVTLVPASTGRIPAPLGAGGALDSPWAGAAAAAADSNAAASSAPASSAADKPGDKVRAKPPRQVRR